MVVVTILIAFIKIFSGRIPGLDNRKLLFEPVEALNTKSGKCQPFFIFYPRLIERVILEADVAVGGKV